MPGAAYTARDNPFRTERILTVRYRHLDTDWDALLARLASLNFRAAVCGPEGSGKTTLLEDLGALFAAQGRNTRWLTLRPETRSAAAANLKLLLSSSNARDLSLLVDGAEQLGPLNWRYLRQQSRRFAGLLITTHAPGRLPTLIECRTTLPLLASIVEQLVPQDAESLNDDLPRLFSSHGGNIRLCLRELYDRYAAIGRS
jgi:hypothetical protein